MACGGKRESGRRHHVLLRFVRGKSDARVIIFPGHGLERNGHYNIKPENAFYFQRNSADAFDIEVIDG